MGLAGRIILIVVLVIVALVVLVLFVPFRYEIDVDLAERRGGGHVYWLFRSGRFHILFDEELKVMLSILAFDIDFLDEDRRQRRSERKEKRDARKRKRKRKKQEPAEEPSRRQRIMRAVKATTRVLSKMREYSVLSTAMPPIQRFLYRSRPRDIHGWISFGLADPSQTGEIVGAIAALPVIYQTDLTFLPDFDTEKNFIDGDVHVKGHLVLFSVVILAVGILRQKNIRAFIGALRNHEG